MFPKWSTVIIADDDYSNILDLQIDQIDRKESIASYNYSLKTLFFSHINKVEKEPMTAEFKLLKVDAVNTKGKMFSVVCDDNTEIAVLRGNYTAFVKVSELRSGSNILIDSEGLMCKIINIEKYCDRENVLYNIKSNKGNNKFVNGLMFKA